MWSRFALTPENPWVAKNVGRNQRHVIADAITLPPREELRDAVDLIVVSPVGEGEQFGEKVIQPRSICTEVHMPGFDFGCLRLHALALAAFRLHADRSI